MIKVNRDILFLSLLIATSISLSTPNIQSSYADSSERFKENMKECKEDFSGVLDISDAIDTVVGGTCITAGILDGVVESLTKK